MGCAGRSKISDLPLRAGDLLRDPCHTSSQRGILGSRWSSIEQQTAKKELTKANVSKLFLFIDDYKYRRG